MIVQSKTTTETKRYITYKLNGIQYLPHYNKECYVGPNYSAHEGLYDRDGNKFYSTDPSREYTAQYLEKLGATKVVEELWSRGKHKAV